MTEGKQTQPKSEKRIVVCPCCKQGKKNLVKTHPNKSVQIPILPDLSSMAIIPSQVDIINYAADQYICESCGITFYDIKAKKMTTGSVQARDAKGNVIA